MEGQSPAVSTRVFVLALAAIVLMALLILVQLAVDALEAASVTPTVVSETANQTCDDLELVGANWTELKVDPPGNGNAGDGTLGVTVSAFNGKSFDWSSNIGVDAVYVKAGAGGSHLYVYSPESTGDTQLSSPGATGNGISHITFCYDAGSTTSTPSSQTGTATPPTTSTSVASTKTPPKTGTSVVSTRTTTRTTRTSTSVASTGTPEANTPTSTSTPSENETNTPISVGGGGGGPSTATRTSTPVQVSTVLGATSVVGNPTLPGGLTLPSAGEDGGLSAERLLLAILVAALAVGVAAAGFALRDAGR